MHLVVLVMGVVTTMAGAIMVGFGIPINGFGIGDTLISSGTTAIVGGLVLIGLAAAVRQLRAVAEAVESQGFLVASGEGRPSRANVYGSTRQRAPSAVAAPPPTPGPPLEREPRFDAPSAEYGSLPRFIARPPPDEPQDREPPRKEAEAYSSPEEDDGDANEPSDEIPFAPGRGANSRGERPRAFDAIWPAASSEPSPRGASYDESKAPASDHDQVESADTASTSILKSGVIDGMVYTLYTDGSIEAELPQGTLKFVSIDELRDYLLNKE
jgi:hypothetical protein